MSQKYDCVAVCFVPNGKHMPWLALLKGARLLAQIAKGTMLGSLPDGSHRRARSNLNVWLFARQPTVESVQPPAVVGATALPVSTKTSHKMQLHARVAGALVVALIDTGAEAGPYLSESFARLHGFHISTPTDKSSVTGVMGVPENVVGHCNVRMKIGALQFPLRCTVIAIVPQFDVLLSDTWLHQHRAIINFQDNTCTVVHDGKMKTFSAVQPFTGVLDPVKPILSFVQVKRLMRQPLEHCLVVVT